ncbi:MAG: recombination protein O N-terminal domain-containing protein [Acidobacteria bacterium]|nr:recombination protein O N-terminal domain-containing protein [Acidobacteriota bacterium]MCB9396761.1 recombination protein O N-terminal domain-containing protein [Acidobacteriota bacterium]
MFQVKDVGYVVEVLALTEHKQLVTLISSESGLLKGIWHLRGRFASRAALAHFSKVDFDFRQKPQQDLGIFESFDLAQPSPILKDPSYLRLCVLQHWAYLVGNAFADHHAEPVVWRLLEHVLPHAMPGAPALRAANLYMEAWLLHASGSFPKPHGPQSIQRDGQFWRIGELVLPETRDQPSESERALISQLFKLKIEQFLPLALECESLSWSVELFRQLWRHFFQRALTTDEAIQSALATKGFT